MNHFRQMFTPSFIELTTLCGWICCNEENIVVSSYLFNVRGEGSRNLSIIECLISLQSLLLTCFNSLALVPTVYTFNGVSLFFVIRGKHLDFLYDVALVDICWIMRNAVCASSSSYGAGFYIASMETCWVICPQCCLRIIDIYKRL